MRSLRIFAGGLAVLALVIAFAPARAGLWPAPYPSLGAAKNHAGLSNLKHLIFIVQENRSFDNFFGTYPGADGFPSPLPCIPDMWSKKCATPWPDHDASNQGGPYMYKYQIADIDKNKMDGFVNQREIQLGPKCKPTPGPLGLEMPNNRRVEIFDEEVGPMSIQCTVDVMGYHDGSDLPNYWGYAQNYVLMDHFYESITSWSLPSHLALFSMWAAECKLKPPELSTCKSDPGGKVWDQKRPLAYLWTDITYMLNQNGITWEIYNDGLGIDPPNDPYGLTGVQLIWNVLPAFQTVQDDNQVANAEVLLNNQFYTDAANGTLPQVSWILPDYNDSDHPQASVKKGQAYVTKLVNAVMSGPDWNSTAIFIVWDDMGGFYDHQPPPVKFDTLGLGIRVPSILISPYAVPGLVDHQLCSTDCYVKFIEDVFLSSERMSQAGRPDPRPDYRDQQTQYGDLANDFNFSKGPRPPLILSTHPMTMLRENAEPPPGIRFLPRVR